MRCAPSGAAARRLTPRRPTQLQGTRGTGPAGRFQIYHAMRAVRRCCVCSVLGCIDLTAWLPDLDAWLD